MLVVLVVPGHVPAHERSGLLDRLEGAGVVRPILHRAELRFGVWVVGGHPGPVVGLGDTEITEVVLQDGGAHRWAGVGVHDVGQPFAGDRVLEHLDGEVVDFTVLDSVADEFATEDVDDRVRLEADTPPRRPQICDVPRPHLPGAGRCQHWCLPGRAGAPTAGRRDRSGGLILDLRGHPPPGAPRAEHHLVIPCLGERVVHGMALGPARVDPFCDLRTVRVANSRRIGTVLLRHRIHNIRARVAAILPRRSRQASQGQRLPLRSGDRRQLPDESVLGVEESPGSGVVGLPAGSCSLITCKSPIAFPSASLVPSNSRIRAVNLAISAS